MEEHNCMAAAFYPQEYLLVPTSRALQDVRVINSTLMPELAGIVTVMPASSHIVQHKSYHWLLLCSLTFEANVWLTVL